MMMNTILKKNKSNSSEQFIINLHRKQSSSKLIISDQRRVVFLSLMALYKTFSLIPTEILYPSILILPLQKHWVLNPNKHRKHIIRNIKLNIDLSIDTNRKTFNDFVQLLQWKQSQNLCFWIHDENDSFWKDFNSKLVTLYNPITNSKYNPIQLSESKFDNQLFQKLLNDSNPNSFNLIISYHSYVDWNAQISLLAVLNESCSFKGTFTNAKKISNSLQGSVWLVENKDTKYVAKVTSKELHQNSATVTNGQKTFVYENIKTEMKILKDLSDEKAPDSIIKYIHSLQTNNNYYLVTEYGGSHTLLEFVQKAHPFISAKLVSISDWHKTVKVIFKQLLNAVNYVHLKGFSHYDISLENLVINDVDVEVLGEGKIRFDLESIQIKLIDFGLAGSVNGKSKKFAGKTSYMAPEVWDGVAFDPFANDIWCCGVCCFAMIIGCLAFKESSMNDASFTFVIRQRFVELLTGWGKLKYVTSDIIDLFSEFFQYENKRITLKKLLNHSWINTN